MDLDTFNTFNKWEEENETVITHWDFPKGSMLIKNTLIAIKNNAFLIKLHKKTIIF